MLKRKSVAALAAISYALSFFGSLWVFAFHETAKTLWPRLSVMFLGLAATLAALTILQITAAGFVLAYLGLKHNWSPNVCALSGAVALIPWLVAWAFIPEIRVPRLSVLPFVLFWFNTGLFVRWLVYPDWEPHITPPSIIKGH